MGEKFDLLQPNSASSASKTSSASGPSQATIKCLEELKEIIGNHLKVATVRMYYPESTPELHW